MAQNQIRVDNEAYQYLSGLKEQPGESFNDQVHKLIDNHEKEAVLTGQSNE